MTSIKASWMPMFGLPKLAALVKESIIQQPTTTIMNTYRIALRSRVPRTALAASGSRCYHTHRSPDARKLTTAGYSSLPNQRQPPRPNTGGDRSVVYIGGALAATGALWYYFTSTEMAGIEQKREGPGSQAQPTMGDATRRARDSAQVALQSAEADYQDVKAGAQRKVREAREEARAGIESGKQYYDEEKDQLGQHAYEARTAAGK